MMLTTPSSTCSKVRVSHVPAFTNVLSRRNLVVSNAGKVTGKVKLALTAGKVQMFPFCFKAWAHLLL